MRRSVTLFRAEDDAGPEAIDALTDPEIDAIGPDALARLASGDTIRVTVSGERLLGPEFIRRQKFRESVTVTRAEVSAASIRGILRRLYGEHPDDISEIQRITATLERPDEITVPGIGTTTVRRGETRDSAEKRFRRDHGRKVLGLPVFVPGIGAVTRRPGQTFRAAEAAARAAHAAKSRGGRGN